MTLNDLFTGHAIIMNILRLGHIFDLPWVYLFLLWLLFHVFEMCFCKKEKPPNRERNLSPSAQFLSIEKGSQGLYRVVVFLFLFLVFFFLSQSSCVRMIYNATQAERASVETDGCEQRKKKGFGSQWLFMKKEKIS